MKLSDLHFSECFRRLRHEGVGVFMPPYRVWLRTDLPQAAEAFYALYAHYPLLAAGTACDFHIRLFEPAKWRRFWGRQVQFALDEFLPFKPLPYDQAHAMLEWGLNWCIGNRDQTHLILHAGVVALNGQVLILPAESGSGKSTLSAALSQEGFQLLSDELCLLRVKDQLITPVPRPVSLKNNSIDLIRTRYPHTHFSRTAHDTRKGTVAHIKCPDDAVNNADNALPAKMIVLPKYEAQSELSFSPLAPEDALNFCITQSFNYHVLGEAGFYALLQLLRTTPVYRLRYSSLDEVIPFLRDKLTERCV